MLPSSHYLRLLDEVQQRFDDPDWPSVRRWIEESARQTRVRQEAFVPTSVQALAASDDPVLHPGDVVRSPLLARGSTFQVPTRCQFDASLHSLGSVTLGEGVHAQDVLAVEAIRWQGGPLGSARNLIAPQLHLASPPGPVLGSLWCNVVHSDVAACDLPPGSIVQGTVVVDEPDDGLLRVGAHSHLGALYVRGDVVTQAHVTISHLQATGEVGIGRESRVGRIHAREVVAGPHCQLGAIVSEGGVTLERGCTVDSVRAGGDLHLTEAITVTGHLLLSEGGRLYGARGDGWHSQPEHWFYLLPDDSLQPASDEGERPEGSRFVALRALTHTTWQQIERLSGRL